MGNSPGPGGRQGYKGRGPGNGQIAPGVVGGGGQITGRVPPDVALMYQGGWIKHGRGVNWLTPDHIPDLGLGTQYYDCLCQVWPK